MSELLTRSTRRLPPLSREVIGKILLQCDSATAKACSLVSKAWRRVAQLEVFARCFAFTVKRSMADEVYTFLVGFPHLLSLLRRVRFVDDMGRDDVHCGCHTFPEELRGVQAQFEECGRHDEEVDEANKGRVGTNTHADKEDSDSPVGKPLYAIYVVGIFSMLRNIRGFSLVGSSAPNWWSASPCPLRTMILDIIRSRNLCSLVISGVDDFPKSVWKELHERSLKEGAIAPFASSRWLMLKWLIPGEGYRWVWCNGFASLAEPLFAPQKGPFRPYESIQYTFSFSYTGDDMPVLNLAHYPRLRTLGLRTTIPLQCGPAKFLRWILALLKTSSANPALAIELTINFQKPMIDEDLLRQRHAMQDPTWRELDRFLAERNTSAADNGGCKLNLGVNFINRCAVTTPPIHSGGAPVLVRMDLVLIGCCLPMLRDRGLLVFNVARHDVA